MKILLLHQFFVLDSDPGGTRHLFLSRFFCRKGAEVRVIAGSVNYMTGKTRLPFPRLWKNEMVDGIRITWIYALPTLKHGIAGKLACYLSFFILAFPFALREKADVLIATSPPPTVAALGWIVHRVKKIPWVFEIRDLWPEMITDLGIRTGIFTRLLERFMAFLYREADHLVPLTLGFERRLIEKGIPPEKIRTITNGVDPIFLKEVPTSRAPRADGKFRVTYLGSMGIANALSPLLDVAELLKRDSRVEFLFVGDGSEREKLLALAGKKALTNVRFMKPVPRAEVPGILEEADVCILTHAQTRSFQLFLPNRLFDYLAAGRPVVLCLKEGDASEILEKSGGGIRIDPDRIDSIRDGLVHFLEHPEEARRMGENGRSYVLRHYLRENLAETYHEILQSVLKGVAKLN